MADSKVIQDIMDNLQDTSETLMKVAADVAAQAEALAEHNTASGSHPYILQKIEDLDSVSMADLNDAITTHSNNTSAHANIITQITQTTGTNTTSAIGTHNTSQSAHPDLRNTINTLNTEMATVRNYRVYIEQLDDLFGGGGGTISLPAIQGMETRLTTAEYTINTINTRVGDLTPRVTTLETSQTQQNQRLDTIETQVSQHTADISELKIRMDIAETKISSFSGSSPDMVNLIHNVPAYVKANTQYNVTFSGVEFDAGQTLAFSIESPTSGISFSKTVGITQSETIVMTIAAGVAPNTVLQFVLRGTLSPSNDTNAITIITRVAVLPDMTSFTVSGIGETSIAGVAYAYSFTPAIDSQGNTITYGVASCSSGTCTLDNATKQGVFTPAANTPSGTVVNIVFRATTVNGYSDKTITTNIAASVNITGLSSTHPLISKPNNYISFSLNGATSSAGGIRYSVAPKSGSVIAFTPNTGISNNDPITMIVPTNASRGTDQTFVVTVTDAVGATAIKEFVVKINSLPVSSGIVINGISGAVNSGSTLNVSFSNGTDADNQTLKYGIYNQTRSNVLFSKKNDITANETINITLDYITENTTFMFDVQVTDTLGEISTDLKTIYIEMLPVYIAQTPEITYPTDNAVLSSDAVTFAFSELVVTTATGA